MKHLNHTPAAQGQQHKRLLSRVFMALFFLLPAMVWGQFTSSTDTHTYYYKIQLKGNTDYYMVPEGVRPNTTNVNVYNVSNDQMIWYFKQAETPYGDYYYIINAVSGKYIKCKSLDATAQAPVTDALTTETLNGNIEPYMYRWYQVESSEWYNIAVEARDFNGNTNPYKYLSKKSGAGNAANIQVSQNTWQSNPDNNTQWKCISASFQCPQPVITYNAGYITISTTTNGVKIYYTTNEDEPTIDPENLYDGPFALGETMTTIKAFAVRSIDDGSDKSSIATYTIPFIESSNEITDMTGTYILKSGFTLGNDMVGTSGDPFKGTVDGGLHTISNATHPFFGYVEDAVIKNVIFDQVNISSGNTEGDAGAIACKATGNTRIYNCGILDGSVGGSNDVGGLVGFLDGNARVVNCYSYADITHGDTVAGIVGYNKVATTAATVNTGTMVMNCMFYGDITGGTTKSPIYGGTNIANLLGGLNTFNYYAYDQLPTSHITPDNYNSALAVEEKYLTRFEFYRLLLNSNKKLAAFYATGSADNADQMLKWVLETADRTIANPKPYPILKRQGYYPSIINPDFEHAPDSSATCTNKGGKLGKTLSVTISAPSGWTNAPEGVKLLDANGNEINTSRTITLIRTDKDFDRFNFNYDKVQLPYYNDYGTKNYTGYKAVTGWKITAITAIPGDPYTTTHYPTTGITDYPYHNYADRKSSNKDLYTVSGRVFSQGAYFDVPYGVTSITIEPYWGNAIYVADPNYDAVYKSDYTGKQNVTQTGTQAVDNTTEFNGQKIRTSITGLGAGTTVYDNAVVLVGNFHLGGVPSNGTTPFTMMSVDEDNDHEPDYSLIYHHKKRLNICPIRFDFLNVIGTAQAQKPNSASLICNFTICKTKGWFEVTNTALIYSSQFEYENLGTNDNNDNSDKVDAPLILLGGVFDQFVSTQSSVVNGKVYYIHVGGNVWIKEFGMGTHSDGSQSTPHVPVSVTGGEFPGFYLTGTYNANAIIREDNAECYISSGYFHEAAGASQEGIKGNVRWQIYNADIDNFFGGGTNDAKSIQGDVRVDIYNSHVTTYCGGPKFGNMQANKKVTTNAEGCIFDKFFGAGYGGLSYVRKKYFDAISYDFEELQKYYYCPTSPAAHQNERGKYYNGLSTNCPSANYGKKGPGVATDFDYEFFVWSTGETGARFYIKFASFSLAQCNDVESTLKNCTINENFYGGGSLGKVVGTTTSTLDDCTVKGNVYGAGFSATLPTIEVRDEGFASDGNGGWLLPEYNSSTGMFELGELSGTTPFEWKHVASYPSEGGAGFIDGNHVKTTQDLSKTNLGQVQAVSLTIKGNSVIGTDGDSTTGHVFGGGEESSVGGNITVTLQGDATVKGNVYGGGNKGMVSGATSVIIQNPTTPPAP